MKDKLQQYGALPFSIVEGIPHIALITSKTTHRWIIPKGHPEIGMKKFHVAENEAWEEAGLIGKMKQNPFLKVDTIKIKKGIEIPTELTVYLMKIKHFRDEWPEQDERERCFVPAIEAMKMVSDDAMAKVIERFLKKFPKEK